MAQKTMTVTLGDGVVEWYRGVFKVPRSTSCWLCQFARWVIRTGVDPDTLLVPKRDGRTLFNPATLRLWADLTVVENDRESARFRKFVPFKGEEK